MKKVSAAKYVEGVKSIYVEKPRYEKGHDGSDGLCDCIGMCRGGLTRAGAKGITNMHGTNEAARKAIRALSRIDYVRNLRVGDVVLKTRSTDDAAMPLPDKYRKGGPDYDKTVGETNFTHIGTITSKDPLEITHMTSPTAKKDTKIGNWTWQGDLPWVDDGAEPAPPVSWAIVWAESGSSVKMRAKPSTSCKLYWDVPIGSQVIVVEPGGTWSEIIWAGIKGYMMSKFLRAENTLFTVHIPGLTEQQASDIMGNYPGAWMTPDEGGD